MEFDWGERPEQQGHFRRKPRLGRRVRIRYAVLEGDDAGREQSAHTVNIGVGGAFVATPDPLPPGTRLVLGITLPGSGREIEAAGEVRWIADGDDDEIHGMGVRFHGLAEDELQLLNDYFASLTSTLEHDDL
jgi:uncharacterized protein (TIGR02266 family)